jgi:cytochrome c biogenesis protein CcdA
MMLGLARLFVVVAGVMLVALGLWIAIEENQDQLGLVLLGLLMAFMGLLMIGVLAFERMRYRSAAAEVPQTVGPPGGEAPGTALEPRFRPTPERFVDPTSGKTMRVFSDPDTGERRYQIDA